MNASEKVAATAAGAGGGPGNRTPAIEVMLWTVLNMIIDKLRLDPKTAAYVYEALDDGRFAYGIDGVEVAFSASAECRCRDGDCVATTYLTTSEAIAAALKLIEYAAKAYEKEKQLEKQVEAL